MANILFTHSYFLKLDPKQWKTMQPYPPLGTIYAAAVLREDGHEVHLFDTMFRDEAKEITEALSIHQPQYLVIYDDCFNYLTKMCLTNMREAAFRMAKLGKKAGCEVIVCSSDSSDHYRLYLEQGADYVIIGEGEITLRELIKTRCSGISADFNKIPGIAFKKEGEVIVTGKRAVLQELDTLPSPAWDLVNVDAYRKRWIKKNGYFSLNMVTTRGCPYKCNWCAKPIYGNRYNCHSPERVANELEFLLNKFQPDHIWFCDDIFGLKPGWVENFANLTEEKKLNFRFKIQSRADLLTNEETVSALAKAGCKTVWLGAESGSQKILDAMDKGITVEEIYQAAGMLKKYNIQSAFFLQFGYPGETLKDISLTMQMVNELLPDDIGISVSYPLPGTKFYENVKQDLKSKANWTDSDDLSLMFRNTYSAGFYKQLHRYLHKTYRKNQAKNYLKVFLGRKKGSVHYRRMFAYPYYHLMSEVEKIRIKKIESDAAASL